MVRYRLDCSLRKHSTGYNIYIKEKSMPLLRTIVQPYMHSSMLYKLRIDPYVKYANQSSDNPNTFQGKKWGKKTNHADASFQIKVLNRNNRVEVRLNFQIDQKKDGILLLIKDYLGGNIGYRKSQDTYYYGSTSFGSAKNVINYFDYFHLLSSKHVNYLKWREAYLIIQNRDHLNKYGIEKVIKLKSTMNRLSDSTV